MSISRRRQEQTPPQTCDHEHADPDQGCCHQDQKSAVTAPVKETATAAKQDKQKNGCCCDHK